MQNDKESIKVLDECANLQRKKGNDYQNPHSIIRQADYYPRGVSTLLDIVHAKMLRLRSVIAAMEHDTSYVPNFESVEDSAKDMINYCSFIVSYCRGGMDGQVEGRDFLNRPTTVEAAKQSSAIRWTGDSESVINFKCGGGETSVYITE